MIEIFGQPRNYGTEKKGGIIRVVDKERIHLQLEEKNLVIRGQGECIKSGLFFGEDRMGIVPVFASVLMAGLAAGVTSDPSESD